MSTGLKLHRLRNGESALPQAHLYYKLTIRFNRQLDLHLTVRS